MSSEVKGKWYRATIEKSKVMSRDGTILDFTIDITCTDEATFIELIQYIEEFHNNPKIEVEL